MSLHHPKTILVVDDDPGIRRLIAAMLAWSGYRVLSAGDGESAIRLFADNPDTDLLLADFATPGMTGPMIAGQIAALKPDIGVLFMSGYDTPAVRSCVVKNGCSLLMKPFTMEQLEAKVRAVLSETP